jgi:hypothetical protein
MESRSAHGSDSCFRMALHSEAETAILKELRMAAVRMSKAVLTDKLMAWEKL